MSLATDHAQAILFRCMLLLTGGECVVAHAFVVQFVPSLAVVGSMVVALQVPSFVNSCLI